MSFLKNVHIFSVFCVVFFFVFFNFVSFTWYFGVSEFATVIWWRNFVNVLWICYFRHMFLVGYTRLTYELHTSLMLLKNLKTLRFCLSQLLFYFFFLNCVGNALYRKFQGAKNFSGDALRAANAYKNITQYIMVSALWAFM